MPGKILVVDDDPVTLNWLKAIFSREGYTVSTAERGETALEQIAADPPDLITLDLVLPDADGLEILRHLRQDPRLCDIRVIILSVRDRPVDIVTGLRAGADDYVPKRPGADVELIAKIRGLLEESRREPVSVRMPQTKQGRLFSFCSAKGGTGTTCICVNTAYALAQLEKERQVLLVDMVFPIGDIGPSIGYESPDTIAKLFIETEGKIEPTLVEKYVSPFQRWGFRVLLGSSTLQEAQVLEAGQIVPLFETLKTMYDLILVDLGKSLSCVSLPILQMSDDSVITVTPDRTVVKMTKRMLGSLESAGIPRSRLRLIDNRTTGRVWISREETEEGLGLAIAGTIPYELENFTTAINNGVPFMSKYPDHAASTMFMDLARMLRDGVRR